MKNIIFILLLIYPNLFGQKSVSFIITDSITKNTIPFVKIIVDEKNKGVYSNEKGLVEFDNLFMKDKLLINHIGYKSKTLSIREILNSNNIMLSPQVYDLTEVIIKGSDYKEIEIGYSKMKSNSSFGNDFRGLEMTVLIKPMGIQNAFINEVILRIKKIAKNNPIVRIHLYQNEEGKPGEEIYLKDNLITINLKHKVIYNIESQNIKLPKDGVFVSMEWIGKYYENNQIYNDTTTKRLNPYIRTKRLKRKGEEKNYFRKWSKEWESLSGFTSGNSFIPLFGLKVEVHE